ncbi:alpha/beta fold hydrolase [Paenibacillus sp. CF384]|uniref:alpha/beta fold hydrolase n=1 Tax=Paenibacillus sp. CF384 TaxID=1884382 RepID=UPI000899C8C3|nr:alpha/beta hydrolase [Paenibacillus sp. CF384]SDW54326.1 Alpha/beta hydrolase family protein [Paenibacillus sp. CF384]
MRFTSGFADSDGVRIHYFDSINQADPDSVPLLICPGLSETAEEYVDVLEFLLPRRCVVLSFRGRGNSDTSEGGYDLDEHVSDIEAVIRTIQLKQFHLFGHSRGVSYALGFAEAHNERQILSLLLGDYPPEHRQMPSGWADEYINDYLIPFQRTSNIRTDAVWGIQRESKYVSLDSSSALPALILRGKLEGSLINDSDLQRYHNKFQHLTVEEFHRSGHDLMGTERNGCFEAIRVFVDAQDAVKG